MTRNAPGKAGDLMRREIVAAAPDMTLGEVTAVLVKNHLCSVPVVDRSDESMKLVGFISERDCLEHLSNEIFYGMSCPTQIARTIMSKHPVCVDPTTDLFTMASIFTHHGMRHLPVVESGELLGMVSRSDILRGLDEYYREAMEEEEKIRQPLDLHQIINHRFIAG